MIKKVLIGTVAVFVGLEIVDYLVNEVILASSYQTLTNLWRPDMKLGIFPIINVIIAFFFCFIFSKGYEGKGLMEGVRYGFYVGMMMSVPYAYGSYAVYPIPYALALQWFIYALIEYILMGCIVALVFGKKAPAPAS